MLDTLVLQRRLDHGVALCTDLLEYWTTAPKTWRFLCWPMRTAAGSIYNEKSRGTDSFLVSCTQFEIKQVENLSALYSANPRICKDSSSSGDAGIIQDSHVTQSVFPRDVSSLGARSGNLAPFRDLYTVEPRYVALGYLELPAISNRIGFPLDLSGFFFQSFTMGYPELGYLEHPAISNVFSLPKLKSNLAISNVRRNTGQHQSGSAVKAPDKMY